MVREHCQTCAMHEDYYRVKLQRYLRAAGSSATWSRDDLVRWDPEVGELRDEALAALRYLIRHAARCDRSSYHADATQALHSSVACELRPYEGAA
jgi:hypothetical protein